MQATDVFPLVPRRRLVGLSFGGMHSARRGSGSDVAGSRPYQPGDDIRAIDWAASARRSSARSADEFIVREHYADEAPRVFLRYLDLAEREPAWRPPRTQRIPPEVGSERPFTAPPDALAQAFEHLRQHRQALPAGSFVFVLSDFLEGADDVWFETLEHRWDIVPVVIQDPVWEQSFPDVAGVVLRLVDPREGRARPVRLRAREVEERRQANERGREELLDRLRGLEVEPVLVSSHDRAAILD